MKTFTVATLSGLVAVVLAAAVPEEASSLVTKADTGIWITLCNDFHGGKPCEAKGVTPGKCTYVDNLGRGYISSVKIPSADVTCTFFSAAGCTGSNITLSSPGTVDLTLYNFDNKIITFECTD